MKILRSDNSREYFSSPFSSFLDSQGILQESFCPNTPPKTGVAERKNRHLLKTAHTMMIHNKVPLRFWSDVVLTSCHLINHMPFSIHFHIPHYLLFSTGCTIKASSSSLRVPLFCTRYYTWSR